MSDRTTPNGRIITADALINLLRDGFQDPFDLVDEMKTIHAGRRKLMEQRTGF